MAWPRKNKISSFCDATVETGKWSCAEKKAESFTISSAGTGNKPRNGAVTLQSRAAYARIKGISLASAAVHGSGCKALLIQIQLAPARAYFSFGRFPARLRIDGRQVWLCSRRLRLECHSRRCDMHPNRVLLDYQPQVKISTDPNHGLHESRHFKGDATSQCYACALLVPAFRTCIGVM